MNRVIKNLNRINYRWSIIGGLFFLVDTSIYDLLSSAGVIKTFLVFFGGVIFFSWIFYWYNKFSNEKSKRYFFIVLLCLLPMSAYLMRVGEVLGIIEKILFGIIPFFLFLPVYYFISDKRDNILYRILALIFTFLAIFSVVFFNKDILNINNFKCVIRGSDYRYGICEIDSLYSLKKNLFGIKISVPQRDEENSIISKRRGEYLLGDIFNSKTNKQVDGEIILFSENIYMLDDVRMTIIPFLRKSGETKTYYLGLFDLGGGFENNRLRHIDSFLIGDDIKIDNIKIDKGYYNDFVSLTFFDSEKNRKEVRLRVGGHLNRFYPDRDCAENGQVLEKIRGDGKKYYVCVFADEKQCEIENYKKGNCPPGGFDISGYSEAAAYCLLQGNYPIVDEGFCYNPYSTEKCLMESYFTGECNL